MNLPKPTAEQALAERDASYRFRPEGGETVVTTRATFLNFVDDGEVLDRLVVEAGTEVVVGVLGSVNAGQRGIEATVRFEAANGATYQRSVSTGMLRPA